MDGANALEILHSLTAKQHALRPAALRTLTRIHTHTDQSQEALRLSDTLVKEYPDTSFEAYGLLAQFYIHFDRRRFAQAEQALSILWQKYSETEKESIETAFWLLYLENGKKATNKDILKAESDPTANNITSTQQHAVDVKAYPNPFNPTTTIRYTLPASSAVGLKIYDVLGREVITLVDGVQQAGTHEAIFDASGLPSGTYLYRLEVDGMSQTGRILLLK